MPRWQLLSCPCFGERDPCVGSVLSGSRSAAFAALVSVACCYDRSDPHAGTPHLAYTSSVALCLYSEMSHSGLPRALHASLSLLPQCVHPTAHPNSPPGFVQRRLGLQRCTPQQTAPESDEWPPAAFSGVSSAVPGPPPASAGASWLAIQCHAHSGDFK